MNDWRSGQQPNPSYKAAGTIHIARFVAPNGHDKQVVEAGVGDDACGISQDGQGRSPGAFGSDASVCAESGDQLVVHGYGETCLLTYGGTVTAGDYLKPGANGTGISTTTIGDKCAARALESGLAGTLGLVQVVYVTLGTPTGISTGAFLQIPGGATSSVQSVKDGVLTSTALSLSTTSAGLLLAPPVTANRGLLSLGSGPFDGSTTGFFAGSAAGTHLAVNVPGSFTGNAIDVQLAGVSTFRVTPALDSTSATSNFLNVTGTLPTTISNLMTGVLFSITSAGSSAFDNQAMSVNFNAGYTGSRNTHALMGTNTAAGTGTGVQTGQKNIAIEGLCNGTTDGTNIGVIGRALNSTTVNVGVLGRSVNATTNVLNIGVLGTANRNNGTSVTQIGGFFCLNHLDPIPYDISAGLVCENNDQEVPALVARGTVPAWATFGLVSVGGGPFDGTTTGKFAGNAAGTHLAVNAVSGFTGDFINCQLAGVSVFRVASAVTGASATSNFVNVTGTFPTVNSTTTTGSNFIFTTAGSSSFVQQGMQITLNAGYTGSSKTIVLAITGQAAGTGVGVVSGSSNVGIDMTVAGSTVGTNQGVFSRVSNGLINVGLHARTVAALDNASNVAVLGCALNAGATSVQCGGHFGLSSAAPVFASCALLADNGATSSPVFIARVAGVAKFTIDASGYPVILSGSGAPGGTPNDGALYVDTTNFKLYLRCGGAWKASAAFT